jgi:RNA polymerase sigma-70 factor (ECF subfamily)
MDEQGLVSRSKTGDIEAFNELVELYQRPVYNLAMRMLANAESAEDATQDTFVSAYRAIGGFRGGSFKSWILRIAANSCRDKMRVARRTQATSLDDLMDEVGDFIADDQSESPEDYAQRRELGRLLAASLACLPEEQRLVVVLSDVQELSYEEIAQVAGISLGTVKSRLNRARLRLRDLLRQRVELLPPEFRQYM